MKKYEEVLKTIVDCIVGDPSAASVEETLDERGVLLTVKVAPGDVGRLIGRSGTTAHAIRTIVRAAGGAENARVSVRIENPMQRSQPEEGGTSGEGRGDGMLGNAW
jgi:predicted RNA-binding protein YlqC (UPF0109 family)